jgi:hypothetical protein
MGPIEFPAASRAASAPGATGEKLAKKRRQKKKNAYEIV